MHQRIADQIQSFDVAALDSKGWMGAEWIRLVVVVLVLTFSTAAAAQSDEGEYARTGPYLGIAGTYAIEEFDSRPIDVENTIGLNARVGYRILPYLAAEVQYEWGSDFDLDLSGGDFGNPAAGEIDGEIDTHLATVNVKGIYASPTAGPFQPYLLVGVGVMHAVVDVSAPGLSDDELGFAARFGGGFDIYFWEHISASLEGAYILPTGDVDDLAYVSFGWGLQYHF